MWPWIRRSRDWVKRKFWPFARPYAVPLTLTFRYERAGLSVPGQPIPWTAECVLVEAVVCLPPGVARRRADFVVRLPDAEAVVAEQITTADANGHCTVRFRLAPPAVSTTAEVLFRHRPLSRLTLPVVTREEFFRDLRLDVPTVSVRLGAQTVACETYVCSQCQGLLASGLLVSPTGLLPLLDFEVQVEIRCERTGKAVRVPARLSSSQLAGRAALVVAAPRRTPRGTGVWTLSWLVGDHVLARRRVRAISRRQFIRSLRLADTRLLVQTGPADYYLARQAPPLATTARVGPCFYVVSAEPGMAGLCPLRVSAAVAGAVTPPLLMEQDVLITDGPVLVAPGTLDAADLLQVAAFELSAPGRSLGSLPLAPVPTASFTAEGGFRPPLDYTWTSAAEDEMNERLSRLLEGNAPSE